MRKSLALTIMASLLALSPVCAQTEDEEVNVITEQPAGKLVENMLLTYRGYNCLGSPLYEIQSAGIANIVEGDDGNIYINNLFDYEVFAKSWVKATRGEGDTIIIKRQLVHTNLYNGQLEKLWITKYKTWTEDQVNERTGKTQTVVKYEQTYDDIKMIYKDGVLSSTDEYNRGLTDNAMSPYGIGCAYYSQGSFYKDLFVMWNVNVSPLDATVVQPAPYDKADCYQMTFYQGTSNYVEFIDAVRQGDKIYLKLFDALDGWVVGTVDGDKVTIASNQYLGHYRTTSNHGNNFHMFCHVGQARLESGSDEWDVADQIELSYDAETRAITAKENDFISIDAKPDGVYYLTYFKTPSLTVFEDVAATPMDPQFLTYADEFESSGSCNFGFMLPTYSNIGGSINPKKMYYNVFLDYDTTPFVLDPEDYDVDEAVTDIYYFADIKDHDGRQFAGYMDVWGNKVHIMRYGFQPSESVGVCTVYMGGGERRCSKILWYDVNTKETSYKEIDVETGIDTTLDSSVSSVRYHDISGREVTPSTKGLIVKTITLNNGRQLSLKYMNK